ncbi:DNA-directed RNA polymerase III subunit RPC7-like [Nasonia vitripennis]|uniref:DNA-directed RNA polymerase III subunit n=1 Tax=Nasonia vitripennis TaxID=7425 RepID=A0A7M7H1G5_NASVI|nr:DNA-directed RNA polymerase III subunit RPC7-like [Nasonia vitripennis]XP_008203031.1 DNA-directed RNA polymerase III subunit RPC7-like [Nasonia vitripennis]
MAARGRGRGKPSLALPGDPGIGKGEVLPPILQPPPAYPPLDFKPLPTTITNELRYLQQRKKEFADFMHESFNNVLPIVVKKDIERYSDRYQDLSSTVKYHERYDWSRMPAELKPQVKKRKGDKTQKNAKKKKKDIDIESKLQELEKKETTANQSDAEEGDKDDDESEDKDVEDKVELEEEEIDEEMDEGTDYVNNYFDNGENYEDDEENLDDGAIF